MASEESRFACLRASNTKAIYKVGKLNQAFKYDIQRLEGQKHYYFKQQEKGTLLFFFEQYIYMYHMRQIT